MHADNLTWIVRRKNGNTAIRRRCGLCDRPDKTRSARGAVMNIDIVFKIAAIGLLVAVLNQLLTKAGKEDIAMMTTSAGLILVMLMVINMVSGLFETIKQVFGLY